ncbi:MAG: thiamine pyrophosphate-dependent enzyme, partial [Myxococcota bacterium]
TIEQRYFFGQELRDFVHTELPNTHALALRHLRTSVDRALARALGTTGAAPGPVHINVPFREPLAPTPHGLLDQETEDAALHGRRASPLVSYHGSLAAPDKKTTSTVAGLLDRAKRPVVVCGPMEPWRAKEDGWLELFAKLGAPVLADPLSQWRFGPLSEHVLTHYDAFLRSEAWRRAHAPDLVLRFGRMPTSKAYKFWRQEHPGATEVLVEPAGLLYEPVQQAQMLWCADPNLAAEALAGALTVSHRRSAWTQALQDAERVAAAHVQGAVGAPEVWEGAVVRAVLSAMRPGDAYFAASSMPIRDLDTFGAASTRPGAVYCNRGANGIDGLISTCLGVSTALDGHVFAVLGDVAFLHDIGGLLATTRGRYADASSMQVTFLVNNNAGGGIFEYLPIARYPEHFDRLFVTTHDVDIAPLCAAYGVSHRRVTTPRGLAQALAARQGASGVAVVEVMIDRMDNVARHRAMWADVVAALDEGGPA